MRHGGSGGGGGDDAEEEDRVLQILPRNYNTLLNGWDSIITPMTTTLQNIVIVR